MRVTLAEQLHAVRGRLPMWVVYDHPTDYPDLYVARLWYSLPEPAPTTISLRYGRLDMLRDQLAGLGFAKLDRAPGDDPKIVETWL